MQKENKLVIEKKPSTEEFHTGTEIIIRNSKGQKLIDMYVLPDGGMVIHDANWVLFNKSCAVVKEHNEHMNCIEFTYHLSKCCQN